MLLKMSIGRLSLNNKKQRAEKHSETVSESDQQELSILPMASTVTSTVSTRRFSYQVLLLMFTTFQCLFASELSK